MTAVGRQPGRKELHRRLLSLGSTKELEGVDGMSDYQLLMVVFTVIGLLISVYALNNTKKK